MSWNNTTIVKKDGKCWNRGMQKWCFYWNTKISKDEKKTILGYRCSLFGQNKQGYNSLSECNKKYGQTYDGKKKP